MTQTVQFSTFDYGASLSPVTLRSLATDEVLSTADTCNELSTDSGVYAAVFSEDPVIAAGAYRLRAVVSGAPLNRYVRFAGTDGEVIYADASPDNAGGGGGGSSLTGPYTRTVTVTDSVSSLAIQGAKVRLYRTGETGTTTANASGVATFTVEAATWSYAITASGYTGQTGTVVVSANGDTPISLVASVTTAPDDPALCAVTIHLRDQHGDDLPDEPVEFTWVEWADTATETPPVLTVPPVQTTDADGAVEVNLYRNSLYKIVYGNAPYTRRVDKTIPDAGSYEVEL